MSKIASELDRLVELRESASEVQSRIEALIPQDLLDERKAANKLVAELETSIKKIAASLRTDHKKTFRGKLLQVVYTNTVSYPKAKIVEHVPPRYLKLVAKSSTSWSIRKAAAE